MPGAGEGGSTNLRDDARGAFPYAALSGGVQILLSLVGMLLLVRYLPPDSYGVWMVIIGLGSPLFMLTSMGFRHSLLRFMPATEDREARTRFFWSVLIRRSYTIFPACVLLNLMFPIFSDKLGIAGQQSVLLLLTPGFLLFSLTHFLVLGLNAEFRQREVFLGSVFLQVVSVSGVLVGIQWGQGLLFFAGTQLVANACYFLFSFGAAIRYLGKPQLQDLRVKHREQPEERSYRRASFLDDLGQMLLSADFSRLILAAFAGSYQVAIYSVASSITDRLRMLMPLEIFRPLTTVTFFKRFEETGTIEEVNRIFKFIFSINRIVTTAFLVLFVPLGQEVLVWLFREDYGASYAPAVILMIAIGVFSMPIGLVAQTLRRPLLLVYSKLAVLLQVAVAIPLVKEYGATGMAVAVAAGELIKNLIVFVMLRREFAIRYPWASTFRFLLAGAVVVASLWWAQSSLNVFVAGLIGGIAWVLSLRIFSVLSSDEKNLVETIVPDRFKRSVRLFLGS